MALSLTRLLLENLKNQIDALELEPAGGGVFEVFVDGEEIFSKARTGEFPDETDILAQVTARVA